MKPTLVQKGRRRLSRAALKAGPAVRTLDPRQSRLAWSRLSDAVEEISPKAGKSQQRLAKRFDALSQRSLAPLLRSGALPMRQVSLVRDGLLWKAAVEACDEGDYTVARNLASAGRHAVGRRSRFAELGAVIAAEMGEWEEVRRLLREPGAVETRPEYVARWIRQRQALSDLRLIGPASLSVKPSKPTAGALRNASKEFFDAVVERDEAAADLDSWVAAASILAQAKWSGPRTSAFREIAEEIETVGVPSFRNYLQGKSVCLIANSPTVAHSGLGELIDQYDVVIRFNSFVIDPIHTGAKTSVHVTIHMHDFNWDVPVDVRIVLSGKKELWIESLKERLRPGKQRYTGDNSLRWPGPELGLVSEAYASGKPTAGFNTMTLLDHLDVNPVIDLIGFDFYESGIYRVDGAEKVPLSDVHKPDAERRWVESRATARSEHVISLRKTLDDWRATR